MSQVYLINLISSNSVERKLVNVQSWQWLWGQNFTDDMVRDFRIYHDRERIGFTEAYNLFTKASGRFNNLQKERALLIVPSLFKGHYRCGGPNVSMEQVQKFLQRHEMWLWSTHDCRI